MGSSPAEVAVLLHFVFHVFLNKFFCNKKILTGRIRTIDLGITAKYIYSPPLYQLSYGEIHVCTQKFEN